MSNDNLIQCQNKYIILKKSLKNGKLGENHYFSCSIKSYMYAYQLGFNIYSQFGWITGGCTFFTNVAEGAGQLLKLPSFVTGIFIVDIRTSLPELVTAFLSVSSGHTEVVADNLIGSNISNLFLIVGTTSLLNRRAIELGKRYMMIDLRYSLSIKNNH